MTKCYLWRAWIFSQYEYPYLCVQNKVGCRLFSRSSQSLFHYGRNVASFQIPRAGVVRISYSLSSVGLIHWCMFRTRMGVGPVSSRCLMGFCWKRILINGIWKENNFFSENSLLISFYKIEFSSHIKNSCFPIILLWFLSYHGNTLSHF